MALRYGYTNSQGITASAAYHKITSVIYNAEQTPNTTAEIRIYRDVSAKGANADELDKMTFTFDMNTAITANLLTQAYKALRKQTSVTDSKGRTKAINYKSKSVADV